MMAAMQGSDKGAVKANVECVNKADMETIIKVWLLHAGEKLKKLQSKAGDIRLTIRTSAGQDAKPDCMSSGDIEKSHV